ncbi:ferritin-like domain-containing protein [Ferrovum myxofaciens]|jgi:bacterioferritin|uniref:Bacterioferritin n=2 Tax=root TaxID=1 RepID=A0A149W143_9PROT|nr:ferritin-like domain-containing protein [Ferrovum myxofaciens]KXW59177.1 bacterioferritin [Ferrovum myxofaciens]NDU93031.1 bacterioferritin [Ferrovum sp.]
MYTDPRLSGYLSRALSHELAAVQQYLMQAKLTGLWGLSAQSAQFRRDVNEELVHAERLMERMLILGIPCNATQLPPIRPGRTLAEMLQIDRGLEIEAIRLYEEAAFYCARRQDGETQALMRALMEDELGHLKELDQQLSELKGE